MLVGILGGLGLFLLGMVLMTDGLKALAGDALRRVLLRAVTGPWSGLAWGALATAIVQSSTATTVTTIGFVSAGLLSFTQSIGVIFGANLGTTSTGWIVSQLGFKVSLGSIAPPVVLLGVAMRLFASGRIRHGGDALAGFGLLFMGIDLLQSGMSGLAERMSPADIPAEGFRGRLMMVGFGVVLTIIVQSSSAAVAMTLAAVQSGAIGIEQAALLVIGQNIGTTFTALLAALGATAQARRTAAVHILFNLGTGAVAFATLPIFMRLVIDIAMHDGGGHAATAIAAFHTAFNILGVALFMPVVRPLAWFIERMLPERSPRATRFLSRATAVTGTVGLEAARRALLEVLRELASMARGALAERRIGSEALDEANAAIRDVRAIVFAAGMGDQSATEARRSATLMHAADHLGRMVRTMREGVAPHAVADAPEIADAVRRVESVLEPLATVSPPEPTDAAGSASPPDRREPGAALVPHIDTIARASVGLAEARRLGRLELLESAARGRIEPVRAVEAVELLLRLDRLAYHAWRAAAHLAWIDGPPDWRPETPDEVSGRSTTSGGSPG